MTKIDLKNYSIFVGDIWPEMNSFLEANNYSNIIVIIDENIRRYCLQKLLDKTNIKKPIIIEIESGERNKNIKSCIEIWKEMMNEGADRNSLCINLGGGVIGDMGGFCASTFKRGIDFIQVPTTLLSQVDSSIGGKLGIDFEDVKNSVGLFKDPKAVFIDPVWLESLPLQQLRSGFAEIIKHSLIDDHSQWEQLTKINDLSVVDWQVILIPSLMVKKRIVEADPYEQNLRKALNFGHTIGHAIESQALHSNHPFLHGEAVAAGMICEAYLSSKITGLPAQDLKSIKEFILTHFDRRHIKEESYAMLIHLMTKDKKNEGNTINFTMLPAIGAVKINQTCSYDLIKESLNYLNS